MNSQNNLTDIELLIQTTDNLCKTLDMVSQNDKKFTDEICHSLEIMSWDTMRMKHQLEEIKEYIS